MLQLMNNGHIYFLDLERMEDLYLSIRPLTLSATQPFELGLAHPLL